MRLVPRTRDVSLAIGSAAHETLYHWYRQRRAAMDRIAARHQVQLFGEAEGTKDWRDQEEHDKLVYGATAFKAMMLGYARTYANDRHQWSYKRDQVEIEFQIDLGEFLFQGKIDLYARQGTTPFLVEHKTAKTITGSYIERLAMDTQTRSYIYGATKGQHLPVKEVLYDIIRKPSLRRKSNESLDDFTERLSDDYCARPSFYFYREGLKYSKDDIESFEYEMRQTHKEYQAIIDGEYGPPDDPRTWGPNDSTCNDFFRLCPYFHICTQGLERGNGSTFTQLEIMHAELGESS